VVPVLVAAESRERRGAGAKELHQDGVPPSQRREVNHRYELALWPADDPFEPRGGLDAVVDPAAAQTALAANFTQFGAASDFGGAAAFNLNGFFSGVASGDGGSADFSGKPIWLVGGDGTGIADSAHLFVIDTGATFEADAPLFAASVDVNSGTPALGAAGGTAVAAGVAGAFQAVPVGVVIPEPGVSVLALFAAGFLALRRRR